MTASSSFHSDKVLKNRPSSASTAYEEVSPASTPVKSELPKDPNSESSPPLPIPLIRTHILGLSALVGQLSSLVLQHFPLDQRPPTPACSDAAPAAAALGTATTDNTFLEVSSPLLHSTVSQIWSTLWATATLSSLHLPTCILQKMELNRLKYPAHLVRVSSPLEQGFEYCPRSFVGGYQSVCRWFRP